MSTQGVGPLTIFFG